MTASPRQPVRMLRPRWWAGSGVLIAVGLAAAMAGRGLSRRQELRSATFFVRLAPAAGGAWRAVRGVGSGPDTPVFVYLSEVRGAGWANRRWFWQAPAFSPQMAEAWAAGLASGVLVEAGDRPGDGRLLAAALREMSAEGSGSVVTEEHGWLRVLHPGVMWGGVGVASLGVVLGLARVGRRLRLEAVVEKWDRGLCPACGYDIAGLAGGAVCPECGADCAGMGEGAARALGLKRG